MCALGSHTGAANSPPGSGTDGTTWPLEPGPQHNTSWEKTPMPSNYPHDYGTQPTPSWETVVTNYKILTKGTTKPTTSTIWLLHSQKSRLCQVPKSPGASPKLRG